MTATIESLTPSQLAAVYNYHADTPVKKFENRQKGARRLLALLAKIEVDPADAISAVIPNAAAQVEMTRDDAPAVTTYPEAMPVAAAIMAEVHAKLATPEAEAETAATLRPAVEAQARWLGFTSMASRNNDRLDFREVSIVNLLRALETAYSAGYDAGHADASVAAPKPAKAPRAKATAAPRAAATGTAGNNARALIVAACSRPEGATSAELYDTTGWKFASWSHQLKLITAKAGTPHEIRKVDGTTRYFLLNGRA